MDNTKEVTGFKLIFGYLGILMIILGVVVLLHMVTFIFYPDEAFDNWYAFFAPGTGLIILGILLSLFIAGKPKGHLAKYEDVVLVLLTWLVTYICGAIPFLFLKQFNFDFTKAIFESTSGFTTTGFSVISDYSSVPNVFFIYRSLTHFIGGVGLVLILTSAISDRHNMRLYTADGHNDKLLPNIVKSARVIFSIYISYIILGSLLLFAVGYNDGMGYFEAFNYSISCVSTGGLGLSENSIGTYNNVGIEIITSILMLLGATSFLVHLYLLKGHFKKALMHSETKLLIGFLVILIPVSTVLVANTNYFTVGQTASYGDIFRVASYTLISCITTTGVSNNSIITTDLTLLGTPFLIIAGILGVIGTQAGSTCGGIKMNRAIYIFKGLYYSFIDSLANKRRVNTHYINKFGEKTVYDNKDFVSSVTFTCIYLIIAFIIAFLYSIILHNNNFGMSMFDSIQTLSNSGLSIGLIGSSTPNSMLIVCVIGMMFGRVEILPILIFPIFVIKRIQKRAF